MTAIGYSSRYCKPQQSETADAKRVWSTAGEWRRMRMSERAIGPPATAASGVTARGARAHGCALFARVRVFNLQVLDGAACVTNRRLRSRSWNRLRVIAVVRVPVRWLRAAASRTPVYVRAVRATVASGGDRGGPPFTPRHSSSHINVTEIIQHTYFRCFLVPLAETFAGNRCRCVPLFECVGVCECMHGLITDMLSIVY